jgi:hypothetical protein
MRTFLAITHKLYPIFHAEHDSENRRPSPDLPPICLSTLKDNSHLGAVRVGVYFTSGEAFTWWNEGSVGSGSAYSAGREIKFETYLDAANGNAWSGRWVSVDGSTVLKDYGALPNSRLYIAIVAGSQNVTVDLPRVTGFSEH